VDRAGSGGGKLMANIPKPTAPVAGNFLMAREWWNYFNRLDASFNVAGLADQLAAIQQELAELSEPGILPVKSVNGKHGAVILDAGDVGADPAGTAAAAVAAHVAAADPHPQYTTEAEAAAAAPVQSVNGQIDDVVLDASDVGAVSSVGLSMPVGFAVANSPVTSSGSFAVTYAAGYQAYTAAESTKLAGISAGATVGADWATSLSGIPANITSWAGITPASKADTTALADYLRHDGTTKFSGLELRYSGTLLNISANTADGADTGRTALCGGGGLGISRGGYVTAYGNEHATLPGQINFFAGSGFDAVANAAAFRPAGNNVTSLGSASSRWSVVYAATGTINTSDASEKTEVRPLTASELAAAAELGSAVGAYQWLAMIAEKGDAARQHIGMTVQRAIEILRSHGLDPFAYGFICYDEWDELSEVVDEEGEIAQAYRPAGNRYSFRMDELLAFIARGMAHRLDAVEQRLAAAGL